MLVLSLSLGMPLLAQTDNAPAQPPAPAMGGGESNAAVPEAYNPDSSGDRMMTPPPVSGQTYPITLGSQERSNLLLGGLSFTTAYTDNALAGLTAHPVSDISYSVFPTVALDETTSRAHFDVAYAPGYTFYNHNSALNSANQNASIKFEYRLSSHVTFSARDSFQKTSNVFNQPPDLSSGGGVGGGAQGPNFSVIAPIADMLSNSGNAGISYQFALNDMLGASGTFSNLHYFNQAQVPGLSDSNSQGGLAFYSHRFGNGQYLGATYQYQRLLAYPTHGVSETQTHAALFFYTIAPSSSRFSVSFFGGPQYSDTAEPPIPSLLQSTELKSWNPAAGASVGWQGRLTSFALSYVHIISGGSGLIGAVKLDSATLSGRQQITRTLSASITGGYAQNDVIGTALASASNGHTISGTASLQQQFGQHLNVQLGYTRLYQSYESIQAIAVNPNTNREFVSISYYFSRPIGR
jgi:hypothetical protein